MFGVFIKYRGVQIWNLEQGLNPHQVGLSESLIRWRGAKWPTKENKLYRLYFCIQSNKKHIEGL